MTKKPRAESLRLGSAASRRSRRSGYEIHEISNLKSSAHFQAPPNQATNLEDLRARSADSTERAAIIDQLADRGIDFNTVASQAGKPDADPFDLLCHLSFNAPVLTRRQRADRVKKRQAAFFTFYAPEAREILNDLLEEYAADGKMQFTPGRLESAAHVSTRECAGDRRVFRGAEKLRQTVRRLQELLYAD